MVKEEKSKANSETAMLKLWAKICHAAESMGGNNCRVVLDIAGGEVDISAVFKVNNEIESEDYEPEEVVPPDLKDLLPGDSPLLTKPIVQAKPKAHNLSNKAILSYIG